MNKILVVDDDKTIRLAMEEILEDKGFSSIEASNGRDAIELFKKESPDAVLLDLKMSGMNGIETMQELKKIDPDVPVIIVTAHGDIETAVETIKLGAYDFIVKPPKFDRLVITLKRAIEKYELERKVKRLDTTVETSLEWFFGKGQAIRQALKQIRQIAWSDFSVIIQGETGTGKSLAAQAVHNMSKRAEKPFVKVDMGVIPETLIESELFGHERGAFTGAEKQRKGFFEIANGGTIFIDEIQNIPLSVQAKLLSVVEEKRIYPLGSANPVGIDVRIIAATNTGIKRDVAEKRFREDLFFRLGEFIISLPSLKERSEDIPHFINRFIVEAGSELNKQIGSMTDEAINLLMHYPWPGNVRELKNVIRRAVLFSNDDTIRPQHIDFLIGDRQGDKDNLSLMPLKELSAMAVRDVEKKAIKQALDITKGNKTKAASVLQIDYKTLLTKIKEYNIQ